ncbi:radical SAM protein, partial [Vannielia litorea]|nr:radical SAM protein [Vannielia litorea]
LRTPGLGTTSVKRILAARRHRTLRYDDLLKIGCNLKNAKPFITCPGWSPRGLTDDANLRDRFAPPPEQLSLF